MDELIKQGQWWWPFIVAFVTALLAFAGSAWGARFSKESEHDQWRRNEKLRVYSQYLQSVTALKNLLQRSQVGLLDDPVEAADKIDELHESFLDHEHRLHLFAPMPVLDASKMIRKAIRELMSAFNDHLAHLATPASHSEEMWEKAVRKVSQRTTDFTVLARLDIGLVSDRRGHLKNLKLLQKELDRLPRRESPAEPTPGSPLL